MEKPVQKRQQLRQLHNQHNNTEVKKPSKTQEVKSEHGEVTCKKNVSTATIHDKNPARFNASAHHPDKHHSVTQGHDINHQSSHQNAKKLTNHEKEQDKSHIVHSEKSIRTRDQERDHAKTDATTSHLDVQKVEVRNKIKLYKTQEGKAENVYHENFAFEWDETSSQMGYIETVKSKFPDKTSNDVMQRQEVMSQQRSRNVDDYVMSVHSSEINEIARHKDINYGSCTISQHPQHSSESTTVDIFHHDDILSSTYQCGGVNDMEKLDSRDIGDIFLSKQQLSNTDYTESAIHPRAASHKQFEVVQKTDTKQSTKSRRLPVPLVFTKKTDMNAGAIRTHGRSNSMVPFLDPNSDIRLSLQSLRPPGRSQSMRLPSTSKIEKPKKLLRELSFSDVDTTAFRNYGALRGKNSLPKRNMSTNNKLPETIFEEEPPQVTQEVKTHLITLIQELLVRGKVTQVGVLDQGTGSLLVSVPAWDLDRHDAIGLIKAAGNSQEIMLKLTIGQDIYTCFKHGVNKIVGRVGEKVLVAHKTFTCVVVGIAKHDTPGSCVYEVSELANALMEKDW